jgi:hypothetical protein
MLHRLNPGLHRRLARRMCVLWLLSLAVTLVQACALPGVSWPQGEGEGTAGLQWIDVMPDPSPASGPAHEHEHDTAAELCQGYCEDTRNTPVQAKPWTDLLDAAMPACALRALPAPAVVMPLRALVRHDPAPPEPAVYVRFQRLTI